MIRSAEGVVGAQMSLGLAACKAAPPRQANETGEGKTIPGPAWFKARYDWEAALAKTSPAFHDFTADRSSESA